VRIHTLFIMAYESYWLVLPIALAWLMQKLFHNVFHPVFFKREITSDGKKEINPYFNLGYASSPYKKQKSVFQRMLYTVGFSLYAIIVLPMFFIDNPVNHVLDGEMKFSATFKLSALVLSALYLNDLVWNEMDDLLLGCHHLAAILSISIIVTESALLPPGLVFIRASSIPFQDAFTNCIGFLFRFNWVADHTFWQTFRMYHYIVANLIVFALEWLFLIYLSEGHSVVVYICILSWELTEIYGMYQMIDFVRNMPQIIKKKVERETKYMAELDQVKEDPCDGESPAFDTVSDVQVELSVLE